MPIELLQGDQKELNVQLQQLPSGWTPGVEVQSIEAKPALAYVGETVNIDVYILYPHPLPVPADIRGTVLVNGTELTGTWTIDFRNPTLRFQYTATHPGTFTARAQTKSATFTVVQQVYATYYSPFGGIRMPRCTELTVPDVEPFMGHPGGDYVMTGSGAYSAYVGFYPIPIRQLEERLPYAYPTVWDPSEAVIRGWNLHFYRTSRLVIIASDYDCQEHWDSKEELAKMIVGRYHSQEFGQYASVEDMYGETCKTCGGTGQVPSRRGTRSCRDCGGDGIRAFIDPVRGLRHWLRPIIYSTIGSQGLYAQTLECPRCSLVLQGPMRYHGHQDHLPLARMLLEHIEKDHPEYPLTQRAWFS